MAAAGGGQVPSAATKRASGARMKLRADAVPWDGGNPNKPVEEVKVYNVNLMFLTEAGFVKTKNDELTKLYEDMQKVKDLIRGATLQHQKEEVPKALKDYDAFLDRAKVIRAEIKEKNALALPIPKKFKKPPRVN